MKPIQVTRRPGEFLARALSENQNRSWRGNIPSICGDETQISRIKHEAVRDERHRTTLSEVRSVLATARCSRTWSCAPATSAVESSQRGFDAAQKKQDHDGVRAAVRVLSTESSAGFTPNRPRALRVVRVRPCSSASSAGETAASAASVRKDPGRQTTVRSECVGWCVVIRPVRRGRDGADASLRRRR
jgi:hypothetical protein